MTLLEQAKQIVSSEEGPYKYSLDRAEVALAYVAGEITGEQARVALGCIEVRSVPGIAGGLIYTAIRRGDIEARMKSGAQ